MHPHDPKWTVPGLALLFMAIVATGTSAVMLHRDVMLVAAPPDFRARQEQPQNSVPAGFVPPSRHAVPDGSGRFAPPSPPVEIAVPVIGVRSRLVGLRLDRNGTLQAPIDWDHAGWYSDGTAPGVAGPPAVIVGHVDSASGPAVFFRLRDLRDGDEILIRQADGNTARFVVYKTQEFAKAAFPATQVYAATGSAEVRLITCSGVFDRLTRHYLGNLVVYGAELPVIRPAAGNPK